MADAKIDVTGTLGRWAADWPGEASAEAFETARMAFCDTIACMVIGAPDAAAAKVRAAVTVWGGGRSTIVGGSQAAAPWAALVNGTAAHALDYDDGFQLGPVHVSAVLVPALLALAEERGASGRQVLESYIAGIEILSQVAQGLSREHYEKGWHSTSTVGTIAAAAACGRLLGLDATAMTHAIGLATSLAGGAKVQFGSMAKALHAGLAAKNGVLAASMAATGMTAGDDPLDHRLGFRKLYGTAGSPGWDALLPKIGHPLAIEEYGIGAKFYPCCRAAHRTLDGVLELRARHGFTGADVASVETVVGFSSAQNLMYTVPENEMQARFSMPYCVAVAVQSGRIVLSDFTPQAIRRPDILALMPKVRMEAMAPSAGDDLPLARAPALVRVTLEDGRIVETRVQHALGTPHKPLSREQISTKYRDCTEGILPPAAIAATEAILDDFVVQATLDDLMRPLRHAAVAVG